MVELIKDRYEDALGDSLEVWTSEIYERTKGTSAKKRTLLTTAAAFRPSCIKQDLCIEVFFSTNLQKQLDAHKGNGGEGSPGPLFKLDSTNIELRMRDKILWVPG